MEKLVVEHPGNGKKEIFFLDKAMATIGRNPSNGICIENEFVSSLHAEIERCEDGSLVLRDRSSRNGTYVNGVLVRGESKVKPGDEIGLGRLTVRMEGKPSKTNSPSSLSAEGRPPVLKPGSGSASQPGKVFPIVRMRPSGFDNDSSGTGSDEDGPRPVLFEAKPEGDIPPNPKDPPAPQPAPLDPEKLKRKHSETSDPTQESATVIRKLAPPKLSLRHSPPATPSPPVPQDPSAPTPPVSPTWAASQKKRGESPATPPSEATGSSSLKSELKSLQGGPRIRPANRRDASGEEAELDDLREQAAAARRTISLAERRAANLDSDIQSREQQRADLEVQIKKLQALHDKRSQEIRKIEEQREVSHALSIAIASSEEALEEKTKLVRKLNDDEVQISNELDKARTRRDSLRAELEILEQRVRESAGQVERNEAASAELEENRKEVGELTSQRDSLREETEDLSRSQDTLRADIARLEPEVAGRREELEGLAKEVDRLEEVKRERERLEASAEESRVELDSLQKEGASLRANLDELQGQDREAQSSLKAALAAVAVHALTRDSAVAETESAREELESLRAAAGQIDDVRDRLDVSRGKLEEVTGQTAAIEGELQTLRQESTTLREEIGGLRESRRELAELEKQREELRAETTEIEQRRDDLRNKIEEREADRCRLDGELKEASSRRDQLSEKVEKLRGESTGLQDELTGLRVERGEALAVISQGTQSAAEQTEIEERKTALHEEIARLEDDRRVTIEETETFKAELEEAHARADEEAARRREIQEELKQHQTRLDELGKERDRVESENAARRGEGEALQSELLVLRGRRDAVQEDLRKAESTVGARREEQANRREELAELETDLVAAREELSETRRRIKARTAELEGLQKGDLETHNLPELTEQFRLQSEIIDREMETKRQNLSDVSNEVEQLLTAVSDARRAQRDIAAHAIEAGDLVEGRERELEQLNSALTRREEELEELQSARDQLARDVKKLRSEVGDLTSLREEPSARGRKEESSAAFPAAPPLRDREHSLFSRRPGASASSDRVERQSPRDREHQRVSILNLTATRERGESATGFWDASGREALPVGIHGLALATDGTLHTDLGSALAEGDSVIVLSGRDLETTLEALRGIRAAGLVALIAWPDHLTPWLAETARGPERDGLVEVLCASDAVIATHRPALDIYAALSPTTPRAHFPAPYPIARSDWDASRGPEERSGILLGGFPFTGRETGSPDREAIRLAVELSRESGQRLSVFAGIPPNLAAELEASGVEQGEIQVVARPGDFAEYIEAVSRHLLLVDPQREARRMGHLAGDVLLTRGICLAGESDLDALFFPGLQLSEPRLSERALELINDPVLYSEVAADAARLALSEISFEATRARVLEVLDSLSRVRV